MRTKLLESKEGEKTTSRFIYKSSLLILVVLILLFFRIKWLSSGSFSAILLNFRKHARQHFETKIFLIS